MRYIHCCIVVFFFFITLCAIQATNIRFNYLDVSQGLSQNSVTALAQDDLGRIWIGTRDGLNLYDGNSIKVFRQVKGNPNSLLGHFVHDIKIYDKTLWVVTKTGVSQLDAKSLNFTIYPIEGAITSICFNDKVYVGTKTGLFELDCTTKIFRECDILSERSIKIAHLYIDNEGTLWISTNKGLFAHFVTGITLKILEENCTVSFVDAQKRIWVGTEDRGLFMLNRQRELEKRFKHDNTSSSLLCDFIRAIAQDAKGNLWVGTFHGLTILDGTTFKCSHLTNTDKVEKPLSHNSIYTLLRDRQDGMWIGTFFGGISYYNNSLYHQYEVVKDSDQGTSFGVIGKIIEDSRSGLWIATEGGGINYLNRKINKFTHFSKDKNNTLLASGNIRSLFMKDNNTLLIGTHLGGLKVLDLPSDRVMSYMHDPLDSLSIPSNIVRDILPYGKEYLLATAKGVVRYNAKSNQFFPFFKDKDSMPTLGLVNCLLEDSFGILWIGTEDYGLFAYNKKTGTVTRYVNSLYAPNSIGDNNISCLFEDHLFRLWIGTAGGGLNQYIRAKNHFESYNITTHKFSSNFILGIKNSNYGGLWVATSKGLTLFNVDKNEVYNYSQENGFPIDELNQGALYLTNDGELFVGGIHGLVSFKEKEMLNQKQKHAIIFSSLYVNNKEVLPHDDTQILDSSIAYTKAITLVPSQNIFTIAYSACNYIKTHKNTYRYKLENFDNDWVEAGDRSSVTYTNLNPGNYRLIVQGLSGVEGDVIGEAQIEIKVLSPIYRTWYAILLYVLIVILFFLWVQRMYRNRFSLENRIKNEQREKNQIIKLNQHKLDFFTNVSHEFRTPLTLIASTLETILENPKTLKENQEKIINTHNNVVRLTNLVTELLDFRKLELGYHTLKVQETRLSDFIEDVSKSFLDYAKHHTIAFHCSLQVKIWLWFDREQMEKVLYNLLSNAFKFVDDVHGKVSVDFKEFPTYVEIYIIDNGIGISKDKATQIFDPYYQIDNIEVTPKRKGTGIGLALCKMIMVEHKGEISIDSSDNGTVFTLKLLKGKAHYGESDLKQEELTTNYHSPKIFNDQQNTYRVEESVEKEMNNLGITMLIVEDNEEARNMLKSIFSIYYKVIVAADGEEGLHKAIENQPDIVVSDVMMPKISGTQLCTMLKRNILTSHIPVLLLTAKATEEFEIEGLELGADGYMTKPFSNKLLKAKVKNMLNNRQLLKEKFKGASTIDVEEVATNKLDVEFLRQIQTIIEKHLDDTNFMTKDLADQMGIGRSKLFDKIKGISDLTPNDYILKIRLTKAAEHLLNNTANLSISEIAYLVGFSTPSYFSKCFKQYYGVTPTDYVTHKNRQK